MKNNAPQTQYDKAIRRRGVLLMAAALLMAFALQLVGIVLGKGLDEGDRDFAAFWMLFGCLVPLLYLFLSLFLHRMQMAELQNKPIEQMQQYLLESRENAEQTVVDAIPVLRGLRRLADGGAVLVGLLGACAALCSGIIYKTSWGTAVLFVSAFLLLSAISRIRFPVPKVLFAENKTYVSASDYPRLYALARQAADAVGCEGNIAISLQSEFNGGIARVGDTYSVQLGAMLLELLSEGELYSVLIHEFAHMTEENAAGNREREYHNWLVNGGNPHFLSGLTNLLYLVTDTQYSYQMFLFDHACSVLVEQNADRAMGAHGDPAYAASALLKMKYYDLYDWEQGTEDEMSFYAPQEPPAHVTLDRVQAFREVMEKRMEDWNALADCEIISRSATHPTLKMRLETLGVAGYRIAESEDDEAYTAECRKAREYVDALILERGSADYKAKRVEAYMKPLARVAEWEQAGKPLTPEGYADVVGDLRSVGRVTDAMALCERAIDELDTAASCYAYFMRGLYRLHRYDSAGIDDLYHAIEYNSNYIDDGLSTIGAFCCLTGRQEELEAYRERAMDVGQMQKDVYSEMNILRKTDTLLTEHLPEELMAGLLDTLRAVDDGNVQSVYLVRKVITEDFFASAVVMRFHGASDEKRSEIMHKVFMYLDTCGDWQFTLFDYDEVKKIKVERIPDSCIYQKERNET